jgi:(2Fe-2S) ferredoxin
MCTASHCAQKGANEAIGKLRLEIVRRGLDSEILINNCGTIDLCDIGPNLVVYPDNVILHGVTSKDVSRVADYLAGGAVPEDLLLAFNTPGEQNRRSVYATAVGEPAPMSTDRFLEIASEHGLGSEWLAEQRRRGFVAVKPGENAEETVQITKKALDRYCLR